MSALFRDLRFAVRQLARNPGFAAAAILILALGIGLNSAVFSLVNATLLRPLPVDAPEDLAAIYSSTPGDFMAASALTTADAEDLIERSRGFTELLAYTYTPVVVEHGGDHRLVLGVRATENFFSTLGLKPFLGRFFSTGDTADLRQAVLSFSAWQRRFGSDPGVVGAKLLVNGSPCTVIGVAPEEFFGLTRGVAPELWLPMRLDTTDRDRRTGREVGWWPWQPAICRPGGRPGPGGWRRCTIDSKQLSSRKGAGT